MFLNIRSSSAESKNFIPDHAMAFYATLSGMTGSGICGKPQISFPASCQKVDPCIQPAEC
jgi:hypothetical protein